MGLGRIAVIKCGSAHFISINCALVVRAIGHVANEKKKWRSRRPMKGLDVPELNGYRLYSTSKYFLVKI